MGGGLVRGQVSVVAGWIGESWFNGRLDGKVTSESAGGIGVPICAKSLVLPYKRQRGLICHCVA